MQSADEVTLVTSFRRSPVRMSVVAVAPLLVAFVQLASGLLAGRQPLIAVVAASAMIAAAVVFTRHHLAQLRLEAIEADGRNA